MEHRAGVIGVALVITIVTLLLLAGHGPWSGDQIVTVWGTHGVNSGDLVVLPLWVAGMAWCAWMWRR